MYETVTPSPDSTCLNYLTATNTDIATYYNMSKSKSADCRSLLSTLKLKPPILPGNNKSQKFLLRKRGQTFTLPHYNYNVYEKTYFSPIVFLSSYNFL